MKWGTRFRGNWSVYSPSWYCYPRLILFAAAVLLSPVASRASNDTSTEPTPQLIVAADTIAPALVNCDATYQVRFGHRDVSVSEAKGLAAELMGRWRFYSLDEPKREPQGWISPCRPDVVQAALLLQNILGRKVGPKADFQAVHYLRLIGTSAQSIGAADTKTAMNALDPAFRRDLERFGPLLGHTVGSLIDQAAFERLVANPAAMTFLKEAAQDNVSNNPAIILAMLSLSKTPALRDLARANHLLNQGRLKTQGPIGLVGQLRARLLSQPETLATTAPAAARAWSELAMLGNKFADAQIDAMKAVEMYLRNASSPEGRTANLHINCALAMANTGTTEGRASLERARAAAAALNAEKSLASLILTSVDFKALGKPIPFTVDDYPARALRNMSQGAVTVGLLIDGTGTPLLANVEVSSGNPDLDDTTLRIWLRRMRTISLQGKWQGKYAWVTLPKVVWRLPSNN